ncbi:COX15/CtaA family protein [Reichenbachiella versicolor]|uniref:COX15/CtaA family protein n=1 Tax=Reichenbachiella versicolor TaxID=1821036 RepID=UPI000D6E4659|nr:COX15/CtaA family protein [Reichenbachiella versicolor]
MPRPYKGLFRRINFITIIAVYFLILVGGIVRSTGSGMGCPDWPKCFGKFVPPTDVSDLPSDYQDLYLNKRLEKNERLAKMFSFIGMKRLSKKIREEESIFVEQEFNFTRTWIEYINRLIGVIIGLLIIATVLSSLSYLGLNNAVVYLSITSLILVVFQGWIGSIVVSTNLLPGMITFHMVLAIGLIALLQLARFKVVKSDLKGIVNFRPKRLRRILEVCMVLFLIQILLGTQIREAIDQIALKLGEGLRESWIENLGLTFYIHRSYSLLLLLLHVYLGYILLKSVSNFKESKILVASLVSMIVLEILTGIVMAYFGLPRFAQPIHLLVGVGVFGAQYYLYLMIKERSSDNPVLVNG